PGPASASFPSRRAFGSAGQQPPPPAFRSAWIWEAVAVAACAAVAWPDTTSLSSVPTVTCMLSVFELRGQAETVLVAATNGAAAWFLSTVGVFATSARVGIWPESVKSMTLALLDSQDVSRYSQSS